MDSSSIIIDDTEEQTFCTYCDRKFVENGSVLNKTNRKRHMDKCARNHKLMKGQKKVTQFFVEGQMASKQRKTDQVLDASTINDNASSSNMVENTPEDGSSMNTSDLPLPNVTTDTTDTLETSAPLPNATLGFCDGFSPLILGIM